MAINEELAKAFKDLSESVKSIQDKMVMLEQHGPTQSGTDPLLSAGVQYSGSMASDSPPSKICKTDGEYDSDEDIDDPEDNDLVTLSEEAATFMEVAFGNKLNNKTRSSS